MDLLMPLLQLINKILIGKPLDSKLASKEKLGVGLGLAVFAVDALSSTAYATDEIFIAFAASSYAAYTGLLSFPVALAIATLIGIVVLSYTQIIKVYQDEGGAYIVAKEHLGRPMSLVAGAALLIDYLLTVVVSISAGVAALTSTGLIDHNCTVIFCVAFTIIITIVNLRGLRESGRVFAFPAYLFIFVMFFMFFCGFAEFFKVQSLTELVHTKNQAFFADPQFSLANLGFVAIMLKAFAHGCAGLTGIEAVANGVNAFKEPAVKRASTVMMVMGILLATIFLGITLLASMYNLSPDLHETVLSQVATRVFGERSFFYYLVQFVTMLLLILAANTAFAGFPRMANLLAVDGYLPRQLMNIGDRLVFNNGIVFLGIGSIFLLWIYKGDTHLLIPLYAVGVFICFTISQIGMVVHHIKTRSPGWLRGVVINGFGGLTTLLVTLVIAVQKFYSGAWIVLFLVPLFVFVFLQIREHYQSIFKQLTLTDDFHATIPSKHKILVLVSSLGKVTLSSLTYAKTMSADIEAVHVELNPQATAKLKADWASHENMVPLKILPSPYRSITRPLLKYIDELNAVPESHWITVIVPEFVTKQLWHNFLHNQTAILLKALLRFRKNTIVITYRFHLED
jgi:amino acid transporter